MKDAFLEGGWPMYPTLAFGLLLLGAALKFALTPERRSAALLACLAVLCLTSGALGFVAGVITTAHYGAANAAPWHVVLQGVGESLQNLGLSLTLVVLSTLVASVGVLRRMSGPPAPAGNGAMNDATAR